MKQARSVECGPLNEFALFLVFALVTSSTLAETRVARDATMRVRSDRYVSTTGSDSNDGSSGRPWRTIQHAGNMAQAGMTIHVAPGTYSSTSPIASGVSGTSTARIRYLSDQKWGAKIVSSATQVWANSGAYVDIEGF